MNDFLTSLAPTVASALLGPLGGIAVAGLGKIFGIDGATQRDITKAIESGRVTPDQLADIQKLELQYRNEESERGFKYSELVFNDRKSARDMQTVTKSNLVPGIALVILTAFISVVIATLFGYSKVDSAMAGTLVGYLSAKAEQVISFYFGSSQGSQAKDVLIANSTPIK